MYKRKKGGFMRSVEWTVATGDEKRSVDADASITPPLKRPYYQSDVPITNWVS